MTNLRSAAEKTCLMCIPAPALCLIPLFGRRNANYCQLQPAVTFSNQSPSLFYKSEMLRTSHFSGGQDNKPIPSLKEGKFK